MGRLLTLLIVVAALPHAWPPAAADDAAQQAADVAPVAVPAADVDQGMVPLQVCFDATSSYHPLGRSFAFRWDFGDGRGTASDPNPCHEYLQAGLYAATVTVTDDDGREDSRAFIVSVRENP
jgi:PKD repeat protein